MNDSQKEQSQSRTSNYSQQYQDLIKIFDEYLKENITEIFINQPQEIITLDNKGKTKYYENKLITIEAITTFLELTGNIINREINNDNPTMSSKIPIKDRNERISGIWGGFY